MGSFTHTFRPSSPRTVTPRRAVAFPKSLRTLIGANRGKDIHALKPARNPWLAAEALPFLSTVVETGEPSVGHEISQAPSSPGDARHWVVSYYPTREAETVIGVSIVLNEVTEQRRATRKLERYRLPAEYTTDILLFTILDGQIVDTNQAAMRAYGYSRAERLSLSIIDLRVTPPTPDIHQQFAAAAMARWAAAELAG